MAAEDVRVLGEIRTEFADSALVSSNERDQESCSDTSLLAIYILSDNTTGAFDEFEDDAFTSNTSSTNCSFITFG